MIILMIIFGFLHLLIYPLLENYGIKKNLFNFFLNLIINDFYKKIIKLLLKIKKYLIYLQILYKII